jgi:uncharacterized protein
VPVIVDTGPLVAALNKRDRHHAWAVTALSRVRPPLATCDAVLSEACFLLGRLGAVHASGAIAFAQRGLVEPSFRLADELDAVAGLMRRYEGVPMSLADACLVRMTELDTTASVMTLDEDFRVYRRNGRRAIRVVAPWSSEPV